MNWTNATRVPHPRTRVLIIYAGGTIGMGPNRTGGLSNLDGHALFEHIEDYGREQAIGWELSELQDLKGRAVAPIDSAGVQPQHWLLLAAHLKRRYADFDGFVILHGTDTLAYTASALSFLLVNLAKPVVLTGAQLPLVQPRTDGRLNLINALLIAGHRASGLPLVPEVCIAFGDSLLRGNRARKARTSGWQGFVSPNYPILGLLGESIHIYPEVVRPLPAAESTFYVEQRLAEDVLDLTLFPGIRASQIEALLSQPELRGLVLRAYGAGNAPSDPALFEALSRAVERGKSILIVSQCPEGRVELGRYASSHGLLEAGATSGFDLTPEAALTKLMWVLASEEGADVRIQLQHDQRGEQSLNQHEVRFPVPSPPIWRNRLALAARAATSVKRGRLERAIVRLGGLHLQPPGAELRVFLNATGVEPGTSEQDVRCIATGRPLEDDRELVLDVTDGVRRLMVDERSFHLTLLPELGAQLQCTRVEMALFTQS
jgi:L-asparaginase